MCYVFRQIIYDLYCRKSFPTSFALSLSLSLSLSLCVSLSLFSLFFFSLCFSIAHGFNPFLYRSCTTIDLVFFHENFTLPSNLTHAIAHELVLRNAPTHTHTHTESSFSHSNNKKSFQVLICFILSPVLPLSIFFFYLSRTF